MNLFVVARNLPAATRAGALATLRAMHRTYPLLDPSTAQSADRNGLFAAWMHTSPEAAAPRVYSHLQSEVLTLYDGCPVAPAGVVRPHDAAELARRWPELHEALEGPFFAVRLDLAIGRLEFLSDPLGTHQTFYWREGEQLIVSNSARLIGHLIGETRLDLVGASLFLGMNWAGDDRTLLEGVRTFPAAQRWVWPRERAEPEQRSFFDLRELARLPRAPLEQEATRRLADELGAMLAQLSERSGALECPITAGRDSRVMTGLMIAHGLPGEYFSSGEDDDPDVRIGREVARALDLPHRQTGRGTDVARHWQEASRRLLEQNDGLVTLAHIQNATTEPERLERLKVHLYGAGGEIARGLWLSEPFLLRRQSRASVEAHLRRILMRNKPLVRPQVHAVIHQHVERSVAAILESGFAPKEAPDVLFMTDCERRWGGAQFRQVGSHKDVFSPFCSRPYVRAAFSLPPALRLSGHLPYRLIHHLSPELHALPFDVPWPPQSALGLYARFFGRAPGKALAKLPRHAAVQTVQHRATREQERQNWLERKLPELRSACLDQTGSPLWQLIDRPAFERLTAPETPPSSRKAHLKGLFQALTLLEYERLQQLSPSPSAREVAARR